MYHTSCTGRRWHSWRAMDRVTPGRVRSHRATVPRRAMVRCHERHHNTSASTAAALTLQVQVSLKPLTYRLRAAMKKSGGLHNGNADPFINALDCGAHP